MSWPTKIDEDGSPPPELREEICDGRLQLFLHLVQVDDDGKRELHILLPLDHASAHRLTREYGPHPLIERYFPEGTGLQ